MVIGAQFGPAESGFNINIERVGFDLSDPRAGIDWLIAEQARLPRRFTEVPSVGWIRAATFFAYVDTPFRFKRKQALWRYMGIGLKRRGSGEGPRLVRVSRDANRVLKNVILVAAMSAIASGKSPFAEQHGRWLRDGMSLRNARRNVARSLATVMWGMWKRGDDYRPEWVGAAVGQAPAV